MTSNDWIQLILYFAVLAALAKPLGWYMARVYQGERCCGMHRVFGWLERSIYRVAGIDPTEEMSWRKYTVAVLLFNAAGFVAVYGVLRLQHVLPFNPQHFPANSPDLAFDTAASFATNTNWQSYGGENTLSYFSQMLALTVQNFVSAATGMAVLLALIRGIGRRSATTIGNFWFDLVRSTVYILLPLSIVVTLVLVSQGVIQNFKTYETANVLQSTIAADGTQLDIQQIAMGPAASQIAIKQLGTNGGGFFNVNSAHPFENPTPLSNLIEMLSILVIPLGLCYTFGVMVGDTRQGWALVAAMFIILVPLTIFATWQEQSGVPAYNTMGVDQVASGAQSGGNMEGKETRFGIVNSAIWSAATTGASNGSVNAMHDSFTPLGGLVPMWLIQLGEIVFGGVGSGLYGMLMFVLVAVFVAGLMVGRTPEYLGKKIEAYEMKMASLVILIPPLVVLFGTAVAVSGPGLEWLSDHEVKSTLNNGGAHGFSEVLYAFSSAGNNNGSAFAGLNANVPFYNIALGLAMFASRYWLMIPTLAIAGSLARKKYTPPSAGTLPTHRPLFVVMLVCTILLVGALTFVPALALGPVVEQLQMLAAK
ncbi:MAG TPA: potassium-transporting ATPase subunit KdpA [Lacipirellulaceae bacterium]|nr:potassium-transporting ATPase subunit KdpA [Lacipirellulaceae bacterium]